MKRNRLLVALLFAPAALEGAAPAAEAQPAAAPRRIVLCAPGYPGSTAEAQPTMDVFAQALSLAASRPAGSLTASYFETVEGGLSALQAPEAAYALVTLPFFLEFGDRLSLSPRLRAVELAAASEQWTLVARAGTLSGPAALAGWELTGGPCFSPAFCKGPALGAWATPPDTVRVTPAARIVTALRRSAAGEQVCVLLNQEQTGSLRTLPFASGLAAVTSSSPMPGSVFCVVGTRAGRADAAVVLDALTRLDKSDAGQQVLEAMRLSHFELLDTGELEPIRKRFSAAGGPATAGP